MKRTITSTTLFPDIAAFAAALGGLDTLVFAGGIGENAPTVGARISDRLEFLGIELEKRRIEPWRQKRFRRNCFPKSTRTGARPTTCRSARFTFTTIRC